MVLTPKVKDSLDITRLTMNKEKFIVIVFLVSLVFCLTAANIFVFSNPIFSKFALSKRYSELAEQVSPNSISAKRYRAISQAIANGTNVYYFTAQRIVPLGTK